MIRELGGVTNLSELVLLVRGLLGVCSLLIMGVQFNVSPAMSAQQRSGEVLAPRAMSQGGVAEMQLDRNVCVGFSMMSQGARVIRSRPREDCEIPAAMFMSSILR